MFKIEGAGNREVFIGLREGSVGKVRLVAVNADGEVLQYLLDITSKGTVQLLWLGEEAAGYGFQRGEGGRITVEDF